MNKKNTIKISIGVLVIFALLFSTVPAQAATISKFTVLTFSGTDIYVDGKFAKHSYGNYIDLYLTYGTHNIKVTKPYYYPWTSTVTIRTPISYVFVGSMKYKG